VRVNATGKPLVCKAGKKLFDWLEDSPVNNKVLSHSHRLCRRLDFRSRIRHTEDLDKSLVTPTTLVLICSRFNKKNVSIFLKISSNFDYSTPTQLGWISSGRCFPKNFKRTSQLPTTFVTFPPLPAAQKILAKICNRF